jgi:multiple sugar transport system permease protein
VEAATVGRAHGRRWQDRFEEGRFLGLVLIAPAVLFITALVGTPLVLAIYLSFTNAIAGSLSGDFVGFDNFRNAWNDPVFRDALKNTVIFTLASQAIVLVSAGILAHFLQRDFRGKWIIRFLILLPWAAPIALGTIGFLWIFDALFSVVNWTLIHLDPYIEHVGIDLVKDPLSPPQWLGDPTLAMLAVIFVHSWRIIPFATVIFLAGLASIPAEVDDAAKVDGATGLKKFAYVTLPLQLPIATVALLFGIVFTATDMAVVYILTRGGPFNETHMLTTWAFTTGIESASLGPGAAISLYLLPVLALVAILMLRFARKVEVS